MNRLPFESVVSVALQFRKFYVFVIYVAPSECQDGFTNNCSHICTRTNLTEHECSCNPGFELSMDICSGMYLYIRSLPRARAQRGKVIGRVVIVVVVVVVSTKIARSRILGEFTSPNCS